MEFSQRTKKERTNSTQHKLRGVLFRKKIEQPYLYFWRRNKVETTTAMVKQNKKRDRFMISPPSAITKSSACSPGTPPLPSAAGQEDEYESALSFLRNFRSKRVAACASSSDAFDDLSRMGPLYTIIESDDERRGSFVEDELSEEFSQTLSVIADDETSNNTASSPRMKKTAKSKCLLDFVDVIYGGSPSSASSSSCSSSSGESILSSHDYDHYFDLCINDDDGHGMRKSMKRSRDAQLG